MNLRDPLCGFFWLAISVFVCLESSKMNIGTVRSPSAGFLPFWAGVALGVFAIILIITGIIKKEVQGETASLWKGMKWRRVILVLLSLFLYGALLSRIGYLIATFGLMILLFGIMKRPRLWIQILSALVTVLATYVLFHIWLKVLLPEGILGF